MNSKIYIAVNASGTENTHFDPNSVSATSSPNSGTHYITFPPLTRNISDLDFEKEVQRLHFIVEDCQIKLKSCPDDSEIDFYKNDVVVKLKGT